MLNNKENFMSSFVMSLAAEKCWRVKYFKAERQLIGLHSNKYSCHMDIYLRSNRVITAMDHPNGISILERSGISPLLLKELFNNPRLHTSKGRRI